MNLTFKLLAATSMLLSTLGSANAALVRYELGLTIESVAGDNSPCSFPTGCPALFGPLTVGQTFLGRFSVDDSILSTDGRNNTAAIYDFFLPFGNLIYSIGPDNTALAGFRNEFGLGALAPGFIIENGQVVDLIGDVYGLGDVPFIDWQGFVSQRNRFGAWDGFNGAQGSLTIAAVPLPSTLALLVLALGVLPFARRPNTD